MATGTPIKFSKLALLIGDGATPEVFSAWCGITGITKTTNKDTGTVAMPDCDDPDLPSWLEVYLVSNQMVISGTGTVAQESFEDFEKWDRGEVVGGLDDGVFRNIRFMINIDPANGGGYYEGSAMLTQWEVAAQNRAPGTFTFSTTFNGQPTWVPAT